MCSFFWWTIQNDLEVNQEHEKQGEQECANWRLSVVMDGSHIIGGPALLWGLKSLKYAVHPPTHTPTPTPNFFHNDQFI